MSRPIEDYGFIGNTVSAALVARDGSLDWLCLPRFDGDACFAALLGGPEHGRWRIAPVDGGARVRRRYRGASAILETSFETAEGRVTLIDFMPFTDDERCVDLVRLVRGDAGHVRLRLDLTIRFTANPFPGGLSATRNGILSPRYGTGRARLSRSN